METYSKIICFCVRLNTKQIQAMVEKSYSLEKLIKQTGASQYCGSCLGDLKTNYFWYKYKKKISEEGNYWLFEDI